MCTAAPVRRHRHVREWTCFTASAGPTALVRRIAALGMCAASAHLTGCASVIEPVRTCAARDS